MASGRRRRGFTLVEAVISVAIMSMAAVGALALLQFHRVQARKTTERAVMLDFAEHYLELARSQPFVSIQAGTPINPFFDGTGGFPNITFPADGAWQNMTSGAPPQVIADFATFNPDLVLLAARQPQYRCVITDQTVGATVRARHIEFEVRWRPPLRQGANWLSIQLDTVVYPDFK